jgi:heavy metal translocating P-type ATPase
MTCSATATGSCSYCGLPLPRPLFGRPMAAVGDGPQYCCTGCRIAQAVTHDSGESGAASWMMTALGLSIFFSMSVMVFTVAHWMEGADGAESGPTRELSARFGQLLQWLALLFTTPVLLLLGKPLVDNVVADLRRGALTSDLLLFIGVATSFTYSMVSVLRGNGPVYFETACVILIAVTYGRWLSATSRLRTNAVLDELEKLLPAAAKVFRNGQWSEMTLGDVAVGDVLLVQAGERIPVDGRVTRGEAEIDEQVFTGESLPVHRGPGDQVFAGTLNLESTIELAATAPARQGAFGALVDAVRRARESRGHFQRLADRVSASFFPVVAVIAGATLLVHATRRGWPDGMLAALAVVLIACPCGLALATPLAVWSAMERAARRGILFRSGEALERLARVDNVRFDKTGTLTSGTPRVHDVILAEGLSYAEFARRAGTLAGQSAHVFSRAIMRVLAEPGAENFEASVHTVSGQGLEAILDGEPSPTRLGRLEWLMSLGARVPNRLQAELAIRSQRAMSLVAIAWNGEVRGLVFLSEEVRPESERALEQLRERGLDLAILTGDRGPASTTLATRLKLPARFELAPADKAAEVLRLQSAGSVVAMVGDGINDAPALSTADVGVALGCGTDVTRSSADVCLLRNDLTSLVEAIDLARSCVRCIRGNLAWAFGYNAIGVAVAATGRLHPSIAAVLMVVSSLVVIARSVRFADKGEAAAFGEGEAVVVDAPGLNPVPARSKATVVDPQLVADRWSP